MKFNFVGKTPASKSILNRLLVCTYYFSDLEIHGESQAEDVVLMRKALKELHESSGEIDCGHAGTVFRFIALTCARHGGTWQLNMSEELRARPQNELLQILSQLSCSYSWNPKGLEIKSDGWRLQGDGLHVSVSRSSQFLSSVLLNSWKLETPLFISLNGKPVSESYLSMTLKVLSNLGLKVESFGKEITVHPSIELKVSSYIAEPDMSSAFALAAAACGGGQVCLKDFPQESIQPDSIFPEILIQMNANITREKNTLKIQESFNLNGIDFNLSNCPDLFPSLAALCCLANGPSRLFGASHLKYKESNRIEAVINLLKPLGRSLTPTDDGLEVSGQLLDTSEVGSWSFDPKNDHRLAMAAAIVQLRGYSVDIKNKDVVEKSFPEFWSSIGVAL